MTFVVACSCTLDLLGVRSAKRAWRHVLCNELRSPLGSVTQFSSDHCFDRPILARRPQPKRRVSRVLFLLVAVVVVGNALVGERGLVAMLRASYDLSELSASIGALRRENSALREEVRALSDEPRRIEALARRELGLIRPGERLFIVSAVPSDDVAIPESLRP